MKGYKTIAVNGALALLPIVDYVVNNGEIVSAVTGEHAAAILSIIGFVNVVLRWITTTPVLKAD